MGHFDDPPAFTRSLHHLMEFYADRARRPGQAGKPDPMITAYQVRPPVLRQLLQELIPLAMERPESGLALCDALWKEPYLEFRLLSTMLLGQIPVHPPDPILQRIESWIKPDLEDYLINALFNHSLFYVRQHEPQALIRQIRNWLISEDTFAQFLGLRALIPIIEDPEFENLPALFRMIQSLTRSSHPSLRQDLLDVLAALAHRSPKETSYFLRQTLKMPSATDTPWLIRQSLHEFPTDIQSSLREEVRGLGT
jgi:hypothetical protein